MKNLLLTGFEKFAHHKDNPTQQLAFSLNNRIINNIKIQSVVLPVEYAKAASQIIELVKSDQFDFVLSLGLAADRNEITPELIAINYAHADIPDNSGIIKTYSKINEQSKESFFSTLPIDQMIKNLNKNKIDAKLSTTAGSYVCNTVMYTSLQTIARNKLATKSGFIHIPANLDQDTLTNALTICINTL